MFLGSSEFAEKYTTFHDERVSYHIGQFGANPFVMVHFVPVSSFEHSNRVDLSGVFNRVRTIPIATSNDNRRINFIGVYSESDDRSCKFQLFRNGITEHATIRILRDNQIYSSDFYDALKKTFMFSLQNYRSLKVSEPLYVMISLYGIEGLIARDIDSFYADHDVVPYEADKMIFPEIFIDDIEGVNLPETLRPIMDALWNAYGFSNYSHELK